ncbi:right-handed parallel beta-helix repeat-containing protein [Promicromonospora sp. NPDC060204]|uniref:right-handed parallel beta-helix repeat-containing protein n=1 Tax=Promicromonospora sp. NPDC060204 TaxID=3347071 RepID=UPI003660A8D8
MSRNWIQTSTVAVAAVSLVAAMGGGGIAFDRLAGAAADAAAAVSGGGCPQLYVSPSGDDRGKGTAKDPFRTVEAARDHIREKGLNRDGRQRCDITVNLAAGEYPVTETIAFTEQDSGGGGHQVVYRSSDGPGAANLVGAEEVTGWEEYQDGIYKTQVDPDEQFYTLFEDGERSELARYPNRGSDDTQGPYLFSRLGEPEKEAVHQWLYWEEGDWDPAWDDTPESNPLKDAQVTLWSGGSWSWFTDIVPIGGADYRKGFATLDNWARYALVNSRSGSRYFIQNALPFLDQAGEYYIDREAGELYYKPRGDIDDVTIMKPTVTQVIDVKGATPEQKAHDITFDGIGIQYSDFVSWYRSGWISAGDSGEEHKYPEYDRQIEMPRNRFGAVTLENTSGITLTGMHVRDTGFMGVYALFANDHLTVENSLFENIGADGIKVEGGWPGEGDLSHHHTFRNLYIHHVGELVPGDAAGIELMGTGDNLVEHVNVRHSARYGISLESRPEVVDGDQYTDHNTFRYIRIDEAGLDSGDMGAFYTYGVDNQDPYPVQNTVDQMVIGDVLPDPVGEMPDSGTRGIHMDAGGCAFSFSNIEVGETTDQSYQSYQCNEVSNANWEDDFDASAMEYDKIGVTDAFPYPVPES